MTQELTYTVVESALLLEFKRRHLEINREKLNQKRDRIVLKIMQAAEMRKNPGMTDAEIFAIECRDLK